jgi:hypothetical protein
VSVEAKGGRARRRGIDLHLVRRLDPRDTTIRDGIPITTAARTLVDLAASGPARQAERALEQAYAKRLLAPGALEHALSRAHGRPTSVLRGLIAAQRPRTITRSELEEAFLAIVRRVGLPDPEINEPLQETGRLLRLLYDAQYETGRRRAGASDRAAARLFFRHAERRAAAARGHDVRVRDLEARALEALREVDRRAVDVLEARRVDQDADARRIEDVVVVAALVERERVLESGAAAAAYADSQAYFALGALTGHELCDLLGSDIGKRDHQPRL